MAVVVVGWAGIVVGYGRCRRFCWSGGMEVMGCDDTSCALYGFEAGFLPFGCLQNIYRYFPTSLMLQWNKLRSL